MQERLDFSRASARRRNIRHSVRGLAAAALSLAFAMPASGRPLPPAPTVEARASAPALWVVKDADTTIYLFGTFHALDQNQSWFTTSIRAAFNASDELVLETLVPENPADLHAALSRNTPMQEPKVGEPVYGGGSSAAPSFVASAGQAMSAGREVGMSVDNGADFVLRRAAEAIGKPVEGLESFEFQLNMFRTLPPAPPQANVHSGNGVTGLLGTMQASWKSGDNSEFVTLLGTMRSQSPQTYQTLFVNRNTNWAGWIAHRMTQPGTVFIAVGTGHLVGPDSVQQMLAARGISSARVG